MKLNETVVALLTLMLLGGCNDSKQPQSKAIELEQLEERNGFAYKVDDPDPYTGKVVEFYEDGQKRSELNYVDGKQLGKQEGWLRNGHKTHEANFVIANGKLHEKYETWYKNGQKRSEKNFVDRKPHGKLEKWYENGQKMLEENYVDGKPHGKKIVWAENGNILKDVNYVDGVQVAR